MSEADEVRQYVAEVRQHLEEVMSLARNSTTEKEKRALITLIVCQHFGWGTEPSLPTVRGTGPAQSFQALPQELRYGAD